MNQPFKDDKNKLIFEIPFSFSKNDLDKENDEIMYKQFRAAGICFYVKNPFKIMMIKSKDRGYEFPGGKIDKKDKDLFDTAVREGIEETNCKIFDSNANSIKDTIEDLKRYIGRFGKVKWLPEFKFKYGLFFIELPESSVFESKTYGDIEEFEKINRNIYWLESNELIDLIKDNNINKFALLKMNTNLKRKFLSWLENKKLYSKLWILNN